jgi:hypothetical protein
MIKNINVIFGKPVKGIKRKKSEKPPKDSPFKKQSIFFQYLSYWIRVQDWSYHRYLAR